jgi:putative FmdB family regulatory protein
MPIYQFECQECGFTFEHMMSIKDGELCKKSKSNCPQCGKKDSVIKIMSVSSFIIHGYSEQNGYSKSNKKK